MAASRLSLPVPSRDTLLAVQLSLYAGDWDALRVSPFPKTGLFDPSLVEQRKELPVKRKQEEFQQSLLGSLAKKLNFPTQRTVPQAQQTAHSQRAGNQPYRGRGSGLGHFLGLGRGRRSSSSSSAFRPTGQTGKKYLFSEVSPPPKEAMRPLDPKPR